MRRPILSTDQVEAAANEVLAVYAAELGTPVTAPVPVEEIADVLDLRVVWHPLPAFGDDVKASRFNQPTLGQPAFISINENLRHTHFVQYPGLFRTALAHEIGHSRFHNEAWRGQQMFLVLPDSIPATASWAETTSKSLTDGQAMEQSLVERAAQLRGPIGDDWWREWQAHTFMRFLLMPRQLLYPILDRGSPSLLTWAGLYSLRDQLDVTISALKVHLCKLDIIAVDGKGVIRPVRVARQPVAR